MIDVTAVEAILVQHLQEKNFHLIDLKIRPGNKIVAEIDGPIHVSVNDCVEVSRFLESALDREKEDFELEIASPGADSPLTQGFQYIKNVGRTLQVETNEGKKFEAELLQADGDKANFFYTERVKVEGKKSKQKVEHNFWLSYSDIKLAKVVIKFK
ncbi:MAG: ribosome assembly cofactor RimP [Luteibaculaceae bacterium]